MTWARLSIKTEHFSYKDWCNVRGHRVLTGAYKEELAWATDIQFWINQIESHLKLLYH